MKTFSQWLEANKPNRERGHGTCVICGATDVELWHGGICEKCVNDLSPGRIVGGKMQPGPTDGKMHGRGRRGRANFIS